ncbi:glycosyltransferase [Synechococcus sp. CBW1107]|uniref:glycosyltransferase family 2 protein n=1 Tax=Synechococcus sp. CBW1107 TaxID=2789857 RepID=UPI0018CE7701|nr:glycosyltransferase [Synechococcus sp. CBW1107]QPN56327.1 glycosyltransferase [Synechococcus sp. CBW1107]
MTGKSCFLMPTFNSAETLSETLASLLATSRTEASRAVDLVILDGGSTDLTHSLCRHYSHQRPNLYFHSLPGTHPGERLNHFFDTASYGYAMICHADDIYDADARIEVLGEMVGLGHWVRGSMHGFFQNPLDTLLQQKRHPYTGHHSKYPTDPLSFRAEIPFWWSISLNTVCYDLCAISTSGIRYDWQSYTYAADYDFHQRLSQSGPCASSARITTITRHDSRSDGPTHAAELQHECRQIRKCIVDRIGLVAFLDDPSLSLFLDLEFCHGTIVSQHLPDVPWTSLREGLIRYYNAHELRPFANRVIAALETADTATLASD